MLTNDKIERISNIVIKIIYKRFENFPEDATNNRNAPFHKSFLNAFSDKLHGYVPDVPFFVSLSSWLHGLNTTLGQTYFEGVAHILSDGTKMEYTSGRSGNLFISKTQQETISNIITDLSNCEQRPSLQRENSLLFEDNTNYTEDLVKAMDFSADVFIEDNDSITAIELKAVRPNSGETRGEKLKILHGKAALSRKFPNKNIKFYMGFPFDPTSTQGETKYDKKRFINSIINMDKYFSDDEVLLSGELWDFLSGEENTMETLLAIINSIATTEFRNIYEFLNDNKNRCNPQYADYLGRWNMQKELVLLNNDVKIKRLTGNNRSLIRVYHQPVFKNGEYNYDRFNSLVKLI